MNARHAGAGGVVRSLRGREALGRLGVLGYVFAFIVAPGAHTARHRADHWHDAAGVVHALPDAIVEASRELEAPAVCGEARIRATAPEHGAGGALHFAVLLLDAASPSLPSPSAALACPAPSPLASRFVVVSARTPRETRGPPLG